MTRFQNGVTQILDDLSDRTWRPAMRVESVSNLYWVLTARGLVAATCLLFVFSCVNDDDDLPPAEGGGGLITFLKATDETGQIASRFGVDHPITVTLKLQPTMPAQRQHH
ncbi:MAG: hypothetical protein ACI9WU_003170 [Myxococcota bacterium]|jgi:hypothetical protein